MVAARAMMEAIRIMLPATLSTVIGSLAFWGLNRAGSGAGIGYTARQIQGANGVLGAGFTGQGTNGGAGGLPVAGGGQVALDRRGDRHEGFDDLGLADAANERHWDGERAGAGFGFAAAFLDGAGPIDGCVATEGRHGKRS